MSDEYQGLKAESMVEKVKRLAGIKKIGSVIGDTALIRKFEGEIMELAGLWYEGRVTGRLIVEAIQERIKETPYLAIVLEDKITERLSKKIPNGEIGYVSSSILNSLIRRLFARGDYRFHKVTRDERGGNDV